MIHCLKLHTGVFFPHRKISIVFQSDTHESVIRGTDLLKGTLSVSSDKGGSPLDGKTTGRDLTKSIFSMFQVFHNFNVKDVKVFQYSFFNFLFFRQGCTLPKLKKFNCFFPVRYA